MANKNAISDFMGAFNGGYRPNRFRVTGKVGAGDEFSVFHVKAASLPASTVTTLQIPFKGRFFKMPGNRTYDPWTITVLDDDPAGTVTTTGSKLWGAFSDWSETFNNHETNEIDSAIQFGFGAEKAAQNDTEGMIHWDIEQLDLLGNSVKKIKLYNCWPTKLGAVVLNMDNNEDLVTFPVTILFQYMEVS